MSDDYKYKIKHITLLLRAALYGMIPKCSHEESLLVKEYIQQKKYFNKQYTNSEDIETYLEGMLNIHSITSQDKKVKNEFGELLYACISLQSLKLLQKGFFNNILALQKYNPDFSNLVLRLQKDLDYQSNSLGISLSLFAPDEGDFSFEIADNLEPPLTNQNFYEAHYYIFISDISLQEWNCLETTTLNEYQSYLLNAIELTNLQDYFIKNPKANSIVGLLKCIKCRPKAYCPIPSKYCSLKIIAKILKRYYERSSEEILRNDIQAILGYSQKKIKEVLLANQHRHNLLRMKLWKSQIYYENIQKKLFINYEETFNIIMAHRYINTLKIPFNILIDEKDSIASRFTECSDLSATIIENNKNIGRQFNISFLKKEVNTDKSKSSVTE